ncbi:ral GTPase-activating protein subunit beta-like [Glandiceps talaboti]
MYSEWASLQTAIQNDRNNRSVLDNYPGGVGKEVAVAVVKHLASSLSLTATSANAAVKESNLQSEKQVHWTMEVVCYGLSLPLSEHDSIRDCVNIYCEWLSVLIKPKPSVPEPILSDPNPYCQQMFKHLVNLFEPREIGESQKQIILCHRVLRTVQSVAKESRHMTRQTWEVLLEFLLAINDKILAPPTEPNGLADKLCDRLVSVLFEIWLLSCARCFPSPPLWKTLRDMCATWRHHESLVEQWNRINKVLTSRVLRFLHGPNFPEFKVGDDDASIIPVGMENDAIAQSWFRFLHVLSNPVDLSRPITISNTPKFLHMALTSEDVIDPHQHPCLRSLPKIYLKAMRGVSVLVDAFLGIQRNEAEVVHTEKSNRIAAPPVPPPGQAGLSPTPTQPRKASKSFSSSVGPTAKGGKEKMSLRQTWTPTSPPSGGTSPNQPSTEKPPPVPKRPQCNSVLHLFGSWLFEASLTGCLPARRFSVGNESRRSASFTTDIRRMSMQPDGSTPMLAPNPLFDVSDSPEGYEAGRAEACGTLCRIFCSQKSSEEILPVYLARFYATLIEGLRNDEHMSGQVLSSIIVNSADLFRIDLKGVQVLVPEMISALEMVLPERDLKFRTPVQLQHLRRASIHLLLSMICLPNHFKCLTIQDLLTGTDMLYSAPGEPPRAVTFQSLKLRLVNLMISALQCETDSTNTQMLLGGMLICVQDSALCEDIEQQQQLQQAHDEATERVSVNSFDSSASTASACTQPSQGLDNSNRQRSVTTENVIIVGDNDNPSVIKALHTLREFDTAWGLFVRCTHLVCQRLMSSWKSDLHVSLAALELLSGLAKVKLHIQDTLECKRAVKWICDYISYQCSRPAPSHSRDLHTMIVAAYLCLSVWIIQHHYLLDDKEYLRCVLEVVELGISGSKSQNKMSDPPIYKHDKEQKPASLRVREAAELVRGYIMDHLGYFPPPCGPSAITSLLNEDSLLKYAKGNCTTDKNGSFKYFVLENRVLLAVLEQPLGNNQDPLPTVTSILRGHSGRHAWTMQLRHLPRNHKVFLADPGRPIPMNDVGTHYEVTSRNFPEIVDKAAVTKADQSIPSLCAIETDNQRQEHEKLLKIIDEQSDYEKHVRETAKDEVTAQGYPNPHTEMKPPKPCQDFHPTRLLLSHMGYLSLEALKEPTNSSMPPALVKLDHQHTGFRSDLELLDSIPSRNNDTVFIFYMKSGQKNAQQILGNVTSVNNVQPEFLELLKSLGWPVEISKHCGWTGHISTSWKTAIDSEHSTDTAKSDTAAADVSDLYSHGGGLFNGDRYVIYYADVMTEIAFVVPSLQAVRKPGRRHSSEEVTAASGTSPSDQPLETPIRPARSPRNLSLDLASNDVPAPGQVISPGSPARPKRFPTRQSLLTGPETKVIVVWLEDYDDHEAFPLDDLLPETSTGIEYLMMSSSSLSKVLDREIIIIFIHPLKSGLYRIHVEGRTHIAIPLMDGMVVSRRSLGTLVRQTALNICRRKRLENDMHTPPHVRRKHKLQEMTTKYRKKMSEPEFYTSLFAEG